MRKIPLSLANLPQLLLFSPRREKDMIFDPTDDKTCTVLPQDLKPGSRGIAAIKDMHE